MSPPGLSQTQPQSAMWIRQAVSDLSVYWLVGGSVVFVVVVIMDVAPAAATFVN